VKEECSFLKKRTKRLLLPRPQELEAPATGWASHQKEKPWFFSLEKKLLSYAFVLLICLSGRRPDNPEYQTKAIFT
jgi:hypothetical protein